MEAATAALLENGIKPMITLYHWDLPSALQDKGGWLNRDIVAAFGRYAAVVAEHFAGRVDTYMTLNEPQCVTALGYVAGVHAPGWKLGEPEALKCYFNLNIFLLLLKVDDIAYCLFAIVKVFDICLKSVRLMKSFLILAALSLIFKLNCKPRIKICSLMKPALYRVCFESCLFKYFSIRKKCNSCTSIIFSACTNLFKWRCCFSTLVSLHSGMPAGIKKPVNTPATVG